MTDPLSSPVPPAGEEPEIPDVPPLEPRRRRVQRLRAWTGGRERRVTAGLVTVALLGAGGLAVAVAAHEGYGERGHREAAALAGDGAGYGAGHGHRQGHGRGHGNGPGDGGAPAALPAVAASAALEKAQAAVPGGRVDSLRRVGEQGGGTAWAVTVVGPDGVRHLVTVDGSGGQLTSNTVVSGTSDSGTAVSDTAFDDSEG
ncbi:hypothetical protein ABTZ03_18690 [Kitasatospora sp. NPDC096077]|uniref:hypothetical protein n=1 Tax=Kitasatospora sp. NPDC096077 TaxID=3155544 RepID=UPI003320944B